MRLAAGDASAYETERPFVWGLCYRITGSTADADDLVQETFIRLMQHPPPDGTRSLRPWLARVAGNLARDVLRRRKRTAYEGTWLPAVLDTSTFVEPAAAGPEARYALRESVSYAFLVALEALTPQQRAVLVLRDVFDFSVAETAGMLGMSEPNVKTTHHRARRAMAGYDTMHHVPRARVEATLQRFLQALERADVDEVRALLAEDVRLLADGGGEYAAARLPVIGSDAVSRFLIGLARRRENIADVSVREVNGSPAVLYALHPMGPRIAPRVLTRIEVDDEGRIVAVHNLLASAKLRGLG